MTIDYGRDSGNETKVGLQTDYETSGLSLADQEPPWREGDQFDQFFLKKLLGRGSSSFVYSATIASDPSSPLALKILHQVTPEQLLLNKQGFRRMMKVNHPNLVSVHLIHQIGDHTAMSMEQVDGWTFAEFRLQLFDMPIEQACQRLLEILRQLASGLVMVHQLGLVHRDLKPANLMITRDGIAKIIDYGLVDYFEMGNSDCKPRGMLLGTPRYIAPEGYWSQCYLPSSDIFCLGIVCLETLLAIQHGKYQRSSELYRSRQSQTHDRELIRQAVDRLDDSIPRILRDTCRDMVARHPSDRPTAAMLSRVGSDMTPAAVVPPIQTLTGRKDELKSAQAWVDQVCRGDNRWLHLCGPAGIGKSRLLEEIVSLIEAKKWGQVFRARCDDRQHQPLSSIDQIADEIANRYQQSDREPLELDPVGAAILKSTFPVLANVLKSKFEISFDETPRGNIDALQAGIRLSHQLRLYGPLFVVVDDYQFVDQDSRNLLNQLLVAVGQQGLGVITVSPSWEHAQWQACQSPPQILELKPLSLDESVAMVERSASCRGMTISETMSQHLARVANGIPFRIVALVNEMLDANLAASDLTTGADAIRELANVDQLWRRRVSQLSDHARRLLPIIATAGGKVSTTELAKISGLGTSVDAAISELVRKYLIRDEATGQQCIEWLGDQVTQSLSHILTPSATQQAHLDWASYLVRHSPQAQSQARIAWHLFAANRPGRALAHAVAAAEDAERRFAMLEAARLYQRVGEYVDGDERITQLSNAARCFRAAEFPVEAANCYRKMADFVPDDQKFECQLTSVALLIRAGRIDDVRTQMRQLALQMRLPKPKPHRLATMALIARGAWKSIRRSDRLLSKLANEAKLSTTVPVGLDHHTRRRLELCFSLVRPLSFFDNLYAAELSMFGSELLLKHAHTPLRIHAAVGEAVFQCYDRGRRRRNGEKQLAKLQSIVAPLGDAKASADVFAGIAISHALAGRWNQVHDPARQSVERYLQLNSPHQFEITHTDWLRLWAAWHLGCWTEFHHDSLQMHADGQQRGDRYRQQIVTCGCGAAAWLMDDRTAPLKRIQREYEASKMSWRQPQLLDGFHWISVSMRLLYAGKYDEAWQRYQAMRKGLAKPPFSMLQLCRILHLQIAGLISLHQLSNRYSEQIVVRVNLLIDRLRREHSELANMIANLYGGLLTQRIAENQNNAIGSLEAIGLLSAARDEATAQQLEPFRLAAIDGLHRVETGVPGSALAAWMRDQGVVKPNQLSRVITLS